MGTNGLSSVMVFFQQDSSNSRKVRSYQKLFHIKALLLVIAFTKKQKSCLNVENLFFSLIFQNFNTPNLALLQFEHYILNVYLIFYGQRLVHLPLWIRNTNRKLKKSSRKSTIHVLHMGLFVFYSSKKQKNRISERRNLHVKLLRFSVFVN